MNILDLANQDDPLGHFVKAVNNQCQTRGISIRLKHLLFCLRDMPYQRPRLSSDPMSVISDWRGTCSGKHVAAFALLRQLGHAPRLVMRAYEVDRAKTLPSSLIEEFSNRGIWDVHNFLLCDLGKGEIVVDITWPLALHAAGFASTIDWDEGRSFVIAAPDGKDIDITPDEMGLAQKQKLLREVNGEESLKAREAFIEALATYSDKLAPLRPMHETIEMTLHALSETKG